MKTTKSQPRRDAIIFLPGIGGSRSDQSVENIAQRVAQALDLRDKETGARYEQEVHFEDIGNQPTRLCTVSRRPDADSPPIAVLDLVEMDYRPTLRDWFEQKALLMKCLAVVLAIFSSTKRFLVSKFAKNFPSGVKTVGQQVQLLYLSSILLVLSCYLVLLLAAAWTTAARLLDPGSSSSGVGETDFLARLFSANGVQLLFVLTTLSGLAAPDTWKKLIESAASTYVCLIHYLAYGASRSEIAGQFREFVERFFEWGENRYRHVHVFSYSFGSIVALDTMFPTGAAPSKRVLEIHTLVTIGSPFDLVRLLWPNYFKGRTYSKGFPSRWFNLYSPNDVIGSNYRDDNQQGPAEVSVECGQKVVYPPPENIIYREGPHSQDLSFLETVALNGLKAHGQYWHDAKGNERNCFDYIIEKMPNLASADSLAKSP